MSQRGIQGYFFERNSKERNTDVSVLSIVNSKTTRSNVRNFHYPFWVLDYSILPGSSCRVKAGKWFERKAGSAHLYAPETRYWEKSSSGEHLGRSSFITFYGGEYLGLTKYVNKSNGFCRFMDKSGRLGKLLTETAAEAGRRGEASYWLVMAKLYEIVEILHGSSCYANTSERIIADLKSADDPSRDEIFIKSLRDYLQRHINENIGIAELAKHLNVSISTVSHKYRTLTGETPGQTLTGLRISAVKNLLIKGEAVKSIADQTGFYDEFHLSKAFKKATGIAPSRYLRSIAK